MTIRATAYTHAKTPYNAGEGWSLHLGSAVHSFVITRIGRVTRLSRCHRGASGERQDDQNSSERSEQLHQTEIGSIRLGSLFLTLPTRVLTGQQVISSDG